MTDRQLAWRINLYAIREFMDDLTAFPPADGLDYTGRRLLIAGGCSEYLQQAHRSTVLALSREPSSPPLRMRATGRTPNNRSARAYRACFSGPRSIRRYSRGLLPFLVPGDVADGAVTLGLSVVVAGARIVFDLLFSGRARLSTAARAPTPPRPRATASRWAPIFRQLIEAPPIRDDKPMN